MGYASLSKEGLILEANLTLAQMLKVPGGSLVKQPLTHYFLPEDQDTYYLHRKRLLETGERQVCELRVVRQDGTHFWARLEVNLKQEEEESLFRVVLIDISEQKKAEGEKEVLIKQLQEALTKVKLLSGLLPICSSCKKIRDDKGYWRQIETYIRDHSEAEFSHALCPECAKKLYPDFEEFLIEDEKSSQTTEK